jgi:hypothetical protein
MLLCPSIFASEYKSLPRIINQDAKVMAEVMKPEILNASTFKQVFKTSFQPLPSACGVRVRRENPVIIISRGCRAITAQLAGHLSW